MSHKTPGNQKHLAGEDRAYIKEALKRNMNFVDIAKYRKKDPTTISREIRKHRIMQKPNLFNNGGHNQCVNVKICQKRDVCNVGNRCHYLCRQCHNCNSACPDFVQAICPATRKASYVCNGCERKMQCRFAKWYYRADPSHRVYKELLVSAREGINMDDASFQYGNSPLLVMSYCNTDCMYVYLEQYKKSIQMISFCWLHMALPDKNPEF